MTDRARLGLIACLITFITCVCPCLLLIQAGVQTVKPAAASSIRAAVPSIAGTVPSTTQVPQGLRSQDKAAIDYAESVRRKNAADAEDAAIDRFNNRHLFQGR